MPTFHLLSGYNKIFKHYNTQFPFLPCTCTCIYIRLETSMQVQLYDILLTLQQIGPNVFFQDSIFDILKMCHI